MSMDPGLAGRLREQEERYGTREWGPMEMVLSRADGVQVWDLQGNRYLDFHSGSGAVNQGHNHIRIAAAMVEQCLRLSLTSRAFRNDRLPPLLDKLCTLTGFEAAVPACTGAEAVDLALKAARRWGCNRLGLAPGEAEVLVFAGASHGRAPALQGLAGPAADMEAYGPFSPGFQVAAFGDLADTMASLGPRVCAILVEPIQGEAGLRLPPRGFLKGLKEVCEARGLLLLAEELQCGLGRTGRLFAFEHEGVRPDGVLVGQALAGGFYPATAFLASRAVLDGLTAGARGSTMAGSPLACAVMAAALDVLREERLAERAAELGAYFLARLRAMESSRIREVRGLGLWAGVELREEAGTADRLCEALAREGLLCRATQGTTIQLCPPLVITREQLDWALEKLERVLGK